MLKKTCIPRFCIFSVTWRCNLDCKGCYAKSYLGSSHSGIAEEVIESPDKLAKRNDLPIAEIKRVISQAADLGTYLWVIAGGEPLLVDDLIPTLTNVENGFFFLFTIVVNYVRKEDDIHQLLNSLLIVFGIICLYGLFMVFTGGDVSAPFEGEEPERNTLGGYLVLMASVAAGVMLHTPSKFEKTLIASALPVFFIVLLFSISRSGWVSGITALIILFIFTKKS